MKSIAEYFFGLFGYKVPEKKKNYKYALKVVNKAYKPWLGIALDNRPYRYIYGKEAAKRYLKMKKDVYEK